MTKQKIIMMFGVPGSGKTTQARALVAGKPNMYVRINRDELREQFGEPHSKVAEKLAIRARDALMLMAIENGLIPILDDTNIAMKHHQAHIKEVLQRFMSDRPMFYETENFDDYFEFEVIDLTSTPLSECIARDKARGLKTIHGRSVGEDVIRKMYNELKPKVQQPVYDPDKKDAIIVDCDGTLALLGNRSPYAQGQYFLDIPNEPVIDLVQRYYRDGFIVLVVTGREGKAEVIAMTKEWLQTNNVPYHQLITRKEADFRNDAIIKQELYQKHIQPYYNIKFVLDDRNRVVDAWRELGLPCWQVAPGDF